MDYMVPAWHELFIDWAYNVPHLDFDDATGQLRLLQDNKQPVGLFLLNYQPNLLERLGQMALSPNSILSVFDYIQDVHHQEGQSLSYKDFAWPAGAYLKFSSFHIQVIVNKKMYAQVIFSVSGRIILVQYYDENEQLTKQLRIDSRGFISREEDFRGDKETQHIYFDEQGNWRINHNLESDQVIVNPMFKDQFAHGEYDHLDELIREVALTDLMPQVYKDGGRMVIALDDKMPVAPDLFSTVPTVYSISQWHPCKKILAGLQNPDLVTMVADREKTAESVQELLHLDKPVTTIPIFYSQFRLGHSQRIAQQRIAIFNENMTGQELMDLVNRLYSRLLKNYKKEQLLFLNYSQEKELEAKQIINQLCADHPGEFRLHKDHPAMIEVDLEGAKKLPELYLKSVRLPSVGDAMTVLDKVRLMIDLGEEPDEFLQMASVSTGIPRLQRHATEEVHDHQNGLVVTDNDQVLAGISYYLDHLKHWNEALASDVQIMNTHSSQRLFQKWQELWK
ncbi:accessory Sec system protein Asp1 [Limosilactobacillus sp.]|jgi:accessory secretory protein Asp1|uniref:accessory Sec system protein Asp1 n=1 Tax=Limosilactobacillus sp. TaxID=2773925 RepID=UPI0025C3DBCE|nr:accessory Sec system protein Asp1 [Limosilactobacillus sp.]MCH3922185.1 accessory Sec system protein Asp1 [Limosilactobacillus sp.]MCH3928956.1 accessory Sec system protein Asp1 [Limosilactobacillus sp.]